MKLYSALTNYGHPFSSLGLEVVPVTLPNEIEENNGILVIWGGGDISPSIYGQRPGTYTAAGNSPSPQDILEINLAKRAIELKLPIIGVCRGAQLLCALAGGKVIQHVEGHGRSHPITTNEGLSLLSTSLHHQMMWPFSIDHKLLAWSTKFYSKKYLGEDDIELNPPLEPEIVWFPTVKTLAIQGHPEFLDLKSSFVIHSLDLAKKWCLNT